MDRKHKFEPYEVLGLTLCRVLGCNAKEDALCHRADTAEPQQSLEQRIKVWMNKLEAEGVLTFSPEGTLRKMKEEWQEFLDDPDDQFELADFIIAAIAHAHTRGWRIGLTIAEKMTINEARTWVELPDGTHRHA